MLTVVNALPALWAKELTLKLERFRVAVRDPVRGDVIVRVDLNHLVFLDNGSCWGSLRDAFADALERGWNEVVDQVGLAEIGSDVERPFVIEIVDPWMVQVDDQYRRLHLRYEDRGEPELHPIAGAQFAGKLVVHVRKFDLMHRKLPELDLAYAFGEAQILGGDAVVVVTESEAGGKMTFRVRPKPA